MDTHDGAHSPVTPSPSLSVHAKAKEQSSKTVLRRELPKGSSIMGVKPNGQIVPMPVPSTCAAVRATGKPPDRKEEVSVEERTGAVKRLPLSNAAIMLHKPMPTSSTIRPPPVTVSNGVKTCQGVNKMTHQVNEAIMRVSLGTTTPRSGKIPSANSIERSDERSIAIIGPAVEQALAFISSEVGEKQWAPDTIVSNHVGEKGAMCSHGCSAAFKLPVSDPTAPSIPHTCAVAHYQQPDESVPPLEVVSRQHEINVVSKVSELSEGRSPGREAAREQSRPTKSATEKGSPISRISFSLGVCSKAQEQSGKGVLDRKFPEGSSLTGRVPHKGTASGSSLSDRGESRVPARRSANKVNIGPGEGLNATVTVGTDSRPMHT